MEVADTITQHLIDLFYWEYTLSLTFLIFLVLKFAIPNPTRTIKVLVAVGLMLVMGTLFYFLGDVDIKKLITSGLSTVALYEWILKSLFAKFKFFDTSHTKV